MNSNNGIPVTAAIAINDMLDNCIRIEKGHEVLILAYLDGLYGGDNMVDQEAISWIQTAIKLKGANASVLWVDELAKLHAWRFPPIVKAAMTASDILINNTLDLAFEEIMDFKQFSWTEKKLCVRNFATTSALLNTKWAQTPHELVSEIRYQASLPFKEGLTWQLTDDYGTHLEGVINPAYNANHPWFTTYSVRREEVGYYRPWPEWVNPPIRLSKTCGIFIFDRMLSWWSRYIGISPYLNTPIRLTIDDGRIKKIEGKEEANALRSFLKMMHERLGEDVYGFNCLHFGVHPNASVTSQQCPNLLYKRLIEHSHCSNIHVHIGASSPTSAYPYWMHCTGDIRTATFKVGDTIVHDKGHLMALDNPTVLAVAEKYIDRPGL